MKKITNEWMKKLIKKMLNKIAKKRITIDKIAEAISLIKGINYNYI
jgi:hypothetical protein